LWLVEGQPVLGAAEALLPALVVSVVTMVVEGVSVWGLDNLTITAVACLILAVWPF
jgi:dolichol kinase